MTLDQINKALTWFNNLISKFACMNNVQSKLTGIRAYCQIRATSFKQTKVTLACVSVHSIKCSRPDCVSFTSQCLSGRPPPTPTVDVRCLDPCPLHVPCSALQATITWMGTMITSTVRPPEKFVAVRVTPLSPHCAVCQLLASSTAALER